MNANVNKQKILDAVDAGFDAQLAMTRDFVAIPSTRGAEGPCQDMMGDLLRGRGDAYARCAASRAACDGGNHESGSGLVGHCGHARIHVAGAVWLAGFQMGESPV